MQKKFNAIYYFKKLIDAILYATLLWIALFIIIYDNAMVYDVSMQPTLNKTSGITDNDIVYYNRYCEYKVGDIVIIEVDDEMIIKRVIADAGDKIQYVYDNNSGIYDLYINNKKVEEDFIKEQFTLEKILNCDNPAKFWDNTDVSGYNPFGQLKLNEPENFDAEGNYVVPDNEVFVMGDNRIHSTDSKSHGGYKTENIVGIVRLVIHHDENEFFKLLNFIF